MRKAQSNTIALNRASEFAEYHPLFNKYKNRKQLKPYEKGQITRLTKKLWGVAQDNGGFGFLTPAPKEIVQKLRRENKDDLLIGGFNILRLNNYNDGKTLKLNRFGDLQQIRKYEKAGRYDLEKGRNFTFVFVDCNFDFSTGKYNRAIKSGAIYDRVKDLIIKRYWDSYNKRKKSMPKTCEFYLWGKQGVMYKRAASSFALLMRWLEEWVELYLDRVIDANGTLSDELNGWAWHSNVAIKKPGRVKKNGKKKNRGRGR